jgi:hypothetical protein
MTLTIYNEIEQGTPEWHDVRRGIPTASTIAGIITPKTIKAANNPDSRAIVAHLVAERITGYTEPSYVSSEMERGHFEEPLARDVYSEHYALATEVGFMVRDDWGFRIGFSPDGVVGDDGLIEIKSRRQKKHLATILADEVPVENIAQCQVGLLVSGRGWLDYVSYCGGMPLWTKRVYPDPKWQTAIVEAVTAFEETAARMIATYTAAVEGRPVTERIDMYEEMGL